MTPQNQPTQQGQEQQQQQQRSAASRGIFGSCPDTTHDHGSEIREIEDLPPQSRACFPGQHDGLSAEG